MRDVAARHEMVAQVSDIITNMSTVAVKVVEFVACK